MKNPFLRGISIGAPLLLLVAVLPLSSARAGGIRLSVEFPQEPVDPKSGIALRVNTTECGTPKDLALEGRAEGIVRGKRLTIPLETSKSGTTGLHDVKVQWPLEGDWVLVFTARAWGRTGSLLVRLAPGGGFEPRGSQDASRGRFKALGVESMAGRPSRDVLEASLVRKGAALR